MNAAFAALALWRGAPLSGLPLETGGRALVQRLEETRLLVLEWRYDAELHLGGSRLDGLAAELAALVAERSSWEGFHRLLMLVLQRTAPHARPRPWPSTVTCANASSRNSAPTARRRLGLVRALPGRGDARRVAQECELLLCLAVRRGDRYTEGLARHQLGLLHRADGDIEEARRQWESALSAPKDRTAQWPVS
ncbi:BTAD domain-containing putative transcriptional regulator [Streptomyces sp. CA-106131]|uniref:BTAD domain-containing putative transcriptional regulator n=1 Tax=Streptomyces sp. CA-106131 TaxID=3240045 RepID=UPI003D8AF67B